MTQVRSCINPSSGSPSGPQYLVFDANPSVKPYPIVAKTLQDGTVRQGCPCEIFSRVIGLGANDSLDAFKLVKKRFPRPTSTSFNYEQAKITTKTSPCTNMQISCPFCLSLRRNCFIWEYDAVAHMATQHPEEKIPLNLLSQMRISLKETEFMKVGLEQMEFYRETQCNESR